MRIILKLLVFICLQASEGLYAQDNASPFLVGIVESFNQQYNDLEDFISPNAICVVDGARSDSSALIVLNKNFQFLHAVYNQPIITIQELVANDQIAMAEWSFSDSIGLVATGMISIHLKSKKIQLVKIFNGKLTSRTGRNGPTKRVAVRRSGGRQGQTGQEQPWWYFIRQSQGGFADPKGLYTSQIFPCDSPKTVPEAFELSDLLGPFNSRQEAGQDRQSTLATFKNLEITTKDANCDN